MNALTELTVMFYFYWSHFRRQIGRVFGIESELLSPAETCRRWPLIECDTLYGALHSPTDGTIDPTAYCLALTRAAPSRGAQV